MGKALSTSINAMAPAFCREIACATIGLPDIPTGGILGSRRWAGKFA
jgi:hypothetical protein